MSHKDVEDEFEKLTRKYLPKNQSMRILDTIWSLEKAGEVGKVAYLLTIR